MIGDPVSIIPHALRARYHRPLQNNEVTLVPVRNFTLSGEKLFAPRSGQGIVACDRWDIWSVPRSGYGMVACNRRDIWSVPRRCQGKATSP